MVEVFRKSPTAEPQHRPKFRYSECILLSRSAHRSEPLRNGLLCASKFRHSVESKVLLGINQALIPPRSIEKIENWRCKSAGLIATPRIPSSFETSKLVSQFRVSKARRPKMSVCPLDTILTRIWPQWSVLLRDDLRQLIHRLINFVSMPLNNIKWHQTIQYSGKDIDESDRVRRANRIGFINVGPNRVDTVSGLPIIWVAWRRVRDAMYERFRCDTEVRRELISCRIQWITVEFQKNLWNLPMSWDNLSE